MVIILISFHAALLDSPGLFSNHVSFLQRFVREIRNQPQMTQQIQIGIAHDFFLNVKSPGPQIQHYMIYEEASYYRQESANDSLGVFG